MVGFEIFDSIHLNWLISIFIAIIFFTILYRYVNPSRFLKIVFWLLLFGEIAKQLYLIVTNQYSYWSPPLHLCGLGIFIAGWYAYRPNPFNTTLLFSLTLPGAFIALVFPGWTYEQVGGFIHIHSFLFHMLLVLFVVAPLTAGELHLHVKHLYISVLFLIVIVPVIYMYNNKFGTNFMFLNKPVDGTPLQLLFDSFGVPFYIVSLCTALLLVWLVMYGLYYSVKLLNSKK